MVQHEALSNGFSAEELLQQEIKTDRNEQLPIHSVVLTDSVLDESKASQLLVEILENDRGQTVATLVRARATENGIVYDVIDGFHRSYALLKLQTLIDRAISQSAQHITVNSKTYALTDIKVPIVGNKVFIKSIVLYGCDDAELYRQRLVAINSVRSVQFARIGEWLGKAFRSHRWKSAGLRERIQAGDLPTSLALNLASSTASRSKNALNKEQVAELAVWARDICAIMVMKPGSLYLQLLLIEQASPELVQAVRIEDGGSRRKNEGNGTLTQARLRAIVTAFPGEIHYSLQRQLVASWVQEHNVIAKDMPYLLDQLQTAQNANDEEFVAAIIAHPHHFKRSTQANESTPQVQEASSQVSSKDALPQNLETVATIAGPLLPVYIEFVAAVLIQNEDLQASVNNLLHSAGKNQGTNNHIVLKSENGKQITFDLKKRALHYRQHERAISEKAALLLTTLLQFEGTTIPYAVLNYLVCADLKFGTDTTDILQIYVELTELLTRIDTSLAQQINHTIGVGLVWQS